MKTLSATGEQPSRFKLTAESRLHRASGIQNSVSSFASSSIQHPASSIPKGVSRISLCPAFTLLELMTVIIIIAILAGMILGFSKYVMTNAAESRAKAEVAAIESALESYKNDNGFYPWSTQTRTDAKDNSYLLYAALDGGTKKYAHFKPGQLRSGSGTVPINIVCTSATLTTNFTVTVANTYVIDPYGNPYDYFLCPCGGGLTNQPTFDLWSFGPDGVNDTGDDIVNWRR